MMRFRRVTLALAIALGGSGCGRDSKHTGFEGLLSVDFLQLRAKNQEQVTKIQNQYERPRLEVALRSFMQSVLERDPRPNELAKLSNGIDGYEEVIVSALASREFEDVQLRYYQNLFEMSGAKDGINFNEPANLAVHLIKNDLDFREILTAKVCINDAGVAGPCSSFPKPADAETQAAGVLTTRAFMNKWAAPFNFRRTSKALQVFACKEYPDVRDDGLSEDEISSTVKTFNSTTASPVCYSCHQTLNPRTALFYSFDRKGFFNPSPNPDPKMGEIAVTDTGAASTVADLLKPGVKPRYYGRTVSSLREYAVLFSQSQMFRDCLARRLVNHVLGKSPHDKFAASFQEIRDHVGMNEFKVKKIYLEIAKHPAFVGR